MTLRIQRSLCAALGWAAFSALSASASTAPDAALARALALYARGDLPHAQAAFTALAKGGDPVALHNLAVMHLRGEVRQPHVDTARTLLERSAALGFVTAQFALGELYESGRLGQRDLPRALQAYLRAAEAGSVEAQLATATAYFMGRGTPANSVQAAHWYRLAANAGDVGAQYILGSMYEKGDGVDVDLRLARYWYAAAARQGDEAAPAKLRELDALLPEVPGT